MNDKVKLFPWELRLAEKLFVKGLEFTDERYETIRSIAKTAARSSKIFYSVVDPIDPEGGHTGPSRELLYSEQVQFGRCCSQDRHCSSLEAEQEAGQ